jgi:hypothetical protein
MNQILFGSVFLFLWLMSLSALSSSSSALEVQFAAILNNSADNSTAIVLEAIRYSISQSQALVAPHTITLNELEVDPEPTFALEPFAQLYQFTANPNRRLHAGIDGTVDGLAKYFLSNGSVRLSFRVPFVVSWPPTAGFGACWRKKFTLRIESLFSDIHIMLEKSSFCVQIYPRRCEL